MPLSPPTHLEILPGPPAPQIMVTTAEALHLWLLYTSFPPSRVALTKVRRGIRVEAGHSYSLGTPLPLDQDEPGLSVLHTYRFPNLLTGARVWFIITASPSYAPGVQTSIPLTASL